MKVCTKCDKEKDLSLFNKGKYACKECIKAYNAKYAAANKYKKKETMAKYYKANKDKIREYRAANKDRARNNRLHKVYKNMSLEKYNHLLREQNECCKICHMHYLNLTKNLAVDHCHNSQQVRGLLCQSCNVALGLLKENVDVLKSAIKYLEDFEKTLTQQYQYDTIDK